MPAARCRRRRAPSSAASPCTTCSDARRFVPASVSASDAVVEVERGQRVARRACAPGASQCRRPAIIRWMTRNSCVVELEHDALAEAAHARDAARRTSADTGGIAVRSTKTLGSRTSRSAWPRSLAAMRSTYTVTSGSSGIAATVRIRRAVRMSTHRIIADHGPAEADRIVRFGRREGQSDGGGECRRRRARGHRPAHRRAGGAPRRQAAGAHDAPHHADARRHRLSRRLPARCWPSWPMPRPASAPAA